METLDTILEVDLRHPKELHDLCGNCPLAPEKINLGIILTIKEATRY